MVIVSSCFNPQSERNTVKRFVEGYRKKYGTIPSMYAAHGYDALMSIAAAMEKTKSTVPAEVAETLRELSYNGISVSPLSFSPNGDLKDAGVVLKKLDEKTKTFQVIKDARIPGIYKPPVSDEGPDGGMGPPPRGPPSGSNDGALPEKERPIPAQRPKGPDGIDPNAAKG